MLSESPGVVLSESHVSSDLHAVGMRLNRLREQYAVRAAVRAGGASSGAQKGGRLDAADGAKLAEGGNDGDGASRPLRQLIAKALLDQNLVIPIDVGSLHRKVAKGADAATYEAALAAVGAPTLEALLAQMAAGTPPLLELGHLHDEGTPRTMVVEISRAALASVAGIEDLPLPPPGAPPALIAPALPPPAGRQPRGPPIARQPPYAGGPPRPPFGRGMPSPFFGGGQLPMAGRGGIMAGAGLLPVPRMAGMIAGGAAEELDSLLSRPTQRERQKVEQGEELLDMLQKPTARESATKDKFKSEGGSAVREYCPHLTKDDCRRARGAPFACEAVHFRRLLFPWTDPALGSCSYLDTCRHTKSCKYMHYTLDTAPDVPPRGGALATARPAVPRYLQALPEAQWVNCDVRTFDLTLLGKFGVIMADPPWEIHQDLPYGTMADNEMRALNIGCLQDDGVIFVWVTGRAMELGRECLRQWGYERVDELVWVKTNQLQRLIRTGRTGHWLNHSKEHCLVGVKGNPQVNRHVDCDVVVAEVRETSRKPDEMYGLLERLSPGTRKLEVFARTHNRRAGWVSLGNQLPGTCIKDPELLERYTARYGEPTPPPES